MAEALAPAAVTFFPGTITVAVVFAGTVTSSVNFDPSRRHELEIGPYGDWCDARTFVSPLAAKGRTTKCLNPG